MNLIEQLNKEIADMNREIAEMELDINEPTPAIDKPKRKRGRPAKVSNEIFVEMWNAALENGSLSGCSSSIRYQPSLMCCQSKQYAQGWS